MESLKYLFSSKGDSSMMRVMSLVCCLTGVGIAIHGINRPAVDYSGLSMLCGTFLGIAFAGKVAQKSIEVKKPEL